MEKHTEMSWKHENVVSQLHNSVDTVTTAVGQAQSHPTQQLIQQAKNLIVRADNAVLNALQNSVNREPIHRLQEQLNKNKMQLQQLQSTKDQ
jgi:predicted lipid-binding transport protein (Tim44 family)